MSAPRTLILDDDPRICRLLERIVGKLGHEVLSVDSGRSFRAAYACFSPNFILVDLQLSEESEDSVSLLRFLAQEETEAYVVLVSGVEPRMLVTTAELGRSMGLTMLEPVSKPVVPEVIRERIRAGVPARLERLPPSNAMHTREALASAIDRGELVVFYQPIVELGAQRLIGAEALVRWRHPDRGLIGPDEFISLAEDNGLIRELTASVIGRAISDLAEWRETRPDLRLSVNLSPTLLTDLTIPDLVISLLRRHRLPPDRLVVEITEHKPTSLFTSAMDVLTRLRLKGVRVALDDFGTGFSSLEQMYRLPYDTLKIDKSFIADIFAKESARMIVESTVALASDLGLDVIAEGVENDATCRALSRMGCRLGQGFHFGRPMNAANFLDWADQWEGRTAARTAVVAPGADGDAGTLRRATLERGDKLLWYEIDSMLGAGGFGITYLANDTNLNQQVAIKEYLPQIWAKRLEGRTVRPLSGDHADAYRRGVQRFLEEARTLARFQHPNIVRISSVFEANGTAYMVMAYQRGESLARRLKAGPFPDQARVIGILAPLLDGLGRIHGSGFIHRDIKPDNIFLREDGSPVLLDFGSARPSVEGAPKMTTMFTPGFAPIEQYDADQATGEQGPWTDIYAMGATVHRMIVGRGPADTVARANALVVGKDDPFIPLETLRPEGYARDFLAGVDRALALQPRDRPQSIDEWLPLLGIDAPDTDAPVTVSESASTVVRVA